MLAELCGDKPRLKVLAKSDLADQEMTTHWLHFLNQQSGVRAVAVTTENIPSIRNIKSLLTSMVPDRADRTIRTMVAGIPNVGKSTIINVLAGRKVAKTGNTPAITKRQQSVPIAANVTLLDTPGVMWPNVENVNSGYRLAVIGSIKETAMDYVDVAYFAARYLIAEYPDRLAERFRLDTVAGTELELLESIGRKRGCLGRNNTVDIDRASTIFVTEIRSGGLGCLTYESPATMERERRQTEIAIAEKEEANKAKELKRKKRFRDKQRAQRKSREMNGQ